MSENVERVLFLECASGASGDMLAASLLDVAARAAGRTAAELLDEVVRPALAAIGVDGDAVTVAETQRGAFTALSFTVADRKGFATFGKLIGALEGSGLAEPVATSVAGAATRMAAAEREAHGGGGESHLHELAGIDTAVDLVAVAALVHHLAPQHVIASPPALGGGVIETAHGELSVPGPAVLAILRGLPTAGGGATDDGELTTPTGAALLASIVDEFGPLPAGVIVTSGCGAGARELDARPNILRAMLVEPGAAAAPPSADAASGAETADAPDAADAAEPASGAGQIDRLEVIEANLDDLTPEMLAHAAEALRVAGALDVWFTDALMKKGRPGVVLHVLVRPDDRDAVAGVFFRETSTFGLRVQRVGRLYLDERNETVSVAGRDIRVRLGCLDDRLVTVAPEYEDCAAAAAQSGLTVKEIHETAQSLARRSFEDD